MMKKLSLVLLLCVLMSVCVCALDSTEHNVNIVYDETNKVVKAELSVSAGNAIVGHFGLVYNTDKLIAADKTFATLPAEIPEKGNDGKSYLTQVISPLASYIVITPESNKPAELINTEKGYILFGWYATKDVDAVKPDKDGGKIAELYFKLKDGVTPDSISASDFSPVTADKCANISGWNKGIIVINSENKVYTYKPADSSPELKIAVGTAKAGEEKGETTETTQPESGNTEENTEIKKEETADTPFVENGEIKDANLGLSVKAFAGKIRLFWSAPEGVLPVEYRVKLTDNNGNTVRTVNGITGITKSLTVKNLAPDFELNVMLSAFSSDGTELKHNKAVKVKTDIAVDTAITVYEVTYTANSGTLYGFDSEQVIFGDVPTKMPRVYAPDGYIFEGWTIDGETIVNLEKYNIYKDTVFIAKFGKK